MVTTYEEIPTNGIKREELANKMVDLIVRVSKYAKSKNPNYKIVSQNCAELYTWSYWEPTPNKRYIEAIDGIGMESVLAYNKIGSSHLHISNNIF